jgi:AcrR family transcriptional regulator
LSRRDEILGISTALLAERGYSDTSMRDIAEAAGLLAGSLYSHFRSKAALVGEIVVRFYDELLPVQRAVLESHATGAEQLRSMIAAVYEVCDAHRYELTILHYDWHALSRLDELAGVQEMSVETLALWQQVIERGKADGSLRPDIDPSAMTRIATSSIHALIDTVRYDGLPLGRKRSPEQAATLQDVLLGGIATDTSP